jgi:predicted RecB family nuclease
MKITSETFEAWLQCPTKAHSIYHGIPAEVRAITELAKDHHESVHRNTSAKLRDTVPSDELYIGTPSVETLRQRRYSMALDCSFETPSIQAEVHGIDLRIGKDGNKNECIPVRFCFGEKVSSADKLLLAFDAFALSQVTGMTPRKGELISSQQLRRTRVALTPLYVKVKSILEASTASMSSAERPRPVLNRHCTECQFASRCASAAKDADDLSLLSKMSAKDRKRYHDKGIFTVTQLSHTFRHRKRAGQSKHDHALKALAIRKNQVHLLGKVAWDNPGTLVYVDVEGDPDRHFYYCIGLRFEESGMIVNRSYWADSPEDEGKMWTECLETLKRIGRPRLVHYGSYETTFFRQMRARYPDAVESSLLDSLIEPAVNLVSLIYGGVYFPTYSNGLKDIAQYLGFRWSEPAASGLIALYWRRQWERTQAPHLKEKLLVYNSEDCAAAQTVAEALSALSRSLPVGSTDFVDAAALKREYPKRFGKIDFALPEFQEINDAAQWDYQRERVYLRSTKPLRRRQEASPRKSMARIDRHVRVEEERPDRCIHCGGTEIKRWGWMKRVTHDLKISRIGIRRWVVRHFLPRYVCRQCKTTFQKFSLPRRKYGETIRAYVMYQVIELQLSQRAVGKNLQQIFSIPMSGNLINRLKAAAAVRYEETYKALLKNVASGTLVHADETRTNLIGKRGYVWVFTNHEEVAFVFSENREATVAQGTLENFKGVLVSDFYTAYDSVATKQQRCLVHLMRDINDDLCKQPFNDEMKEISRKFASLLRSIVESVDRFGLRTRHLRKHRPAVDRFFNEILGRTYQTEVATGYQKRLAKNRERLFTFLDHDGIPWNNNNAEHAIKAFARLRNIFGGTSTVKGMQEYLVLLSISETCKNKGVSFLDFLLSGESDVNQFSARARRSSYAYVRRKGGAVPNPPIS